MADPNEVASLIFGEGVSPAEVQAFIQLWNLIAQENGLPLVEGNIFPDAIFEQMQQDDNFLFSVQTALLETERVLVEIEQEAAAPPEPEDGVAPPAAEEAPPPVGEPLTDDQLIALDLKSSEFDDVNNFVELTGRNPTQAELDNIIQPDINFADQLEQIYFGALIEAGLWPPKSPEYRKFIEDRFKAILSDVRGLPETPDTIEQIRAELEAPENLPPKENVFIRQEQERESLREQFGPAFDRIAAEMELFTGLPDDVRANAEDRLKRQFVEAKVRNPASVVAEDFVRENLTRTIQQVQRQFQATPPVPTFELEGGEERQRELTEAQAELGRLTEEFETTEGLPPEELIAASKRVKAADEAARHAGALADLARLTTGPGVRVRELGQEQRGAFERVIGEQDPGFQEFLRGRFPSFESASTRALRQEAAALPGGGSAITGGATFESFLRETFSGLQAETPEALQAEATRQRAVASRQAQRGRRRATTFVLPPR